MASVLIAVVFGFVQCGSSGSTGGSGAPTAAPTSALPSSPTPSRPADAPLELVEMEYGQEAVEVPVTGVLPPGVDTPEPAPPGTEPYRARPLVVTLRNTGDDPLVLTGIKVVLHEVFPVPGCASGIGGGVSSTLDYDFRFPEPPIEEWSATGPQNFAVDPHSVDALSITIGPAASGDVIYVWRYSVYALTAGGAETLWGGGVGTDGFGISVENYAAYTRFGEPTAATPAEIRACAQGVVEKVQGFTNPPAERAFAVQPETANLVKAYQDLAA